MKVIGHGIDLVEISRIARMLDEHGERFPERCFTEAERAYADAGTRRRVERYAARFAAKEAILKALGTGWRDGIAWRDMEIRRLPSGQPQVHLTGRVAEIAREQMVASWVVSLSHADSHAIASVISLGIE